MILSVAGAAIAVISAVSRLIADVRADMRAEGTEIRADVRALTTAVLAQHAKPQ